MSGIQQELLGGPFGGAPAGYQIERSLRFNQPDSTYLNRTPGSAGNRKTWTWSAWIKLSTLGTVRHMFFGSSGDLTPGTDYGTTIRFDGSNNLEIFDYTNGGFNFDLVTTQVFRDPSSWYHIVVAFDTTQATSTNRVKLYINGSQVTAFGTATYPAQNTDYWINSANSQLIGDLTANGGGGSTTQYFSGYMAEMYFIDGQALTPSSFGETNADTGVWQPKAYTGTYGTNGFQLLFADNSGTTSTTLGKDTSGNGNNWTPNNFSVTAGVGNDSLVDTPTPYGTDTGVGGEVRGNYCTLNATSPGITALANGNLQFNYNATNSAPGTIGVTSGKWYFEGVVTTQVSSEQIIGVVNQTWVNSTGVGENANGWGIIVQSNANNGQAYHNGSVTSSYATFANGDIAMVAFDVDSGKIWFGRNGTWFNSGAPASGTGNIYSNLSGTIFPAFDNRVTSGGTLYANFGQRPFAYTAPSGFKALCTQNLPTPTIGATSSTRADDYFNTVLYTGTGSSQNITGVGFQPDFVWIKERNAAADHALYDAVRGVQQQLESNTTTDETTESTGLTAFGSDGFTVGSLAQVNTSTDTYVAWNWKESTVSKFDIVTYTGNGTARTISHNLGVVPNMIIVKARTTASTDQGWPVYHSANTANPETDYLLLNSVAATADLDTVWNDTAPTSSVFSVGTNALVNANNDTYVAYLFANVAGYSAFGSYTGNGSSDGPFVYTGFRPAYVLIKGSNDDSITRNWVIKDKLRAAAYNPQDGNLYTNLSNAEDTTSSVYVDLLSNGFKIRGTYGGVNASSESYIYAAFAEFPFKYTLAR